ncbi:MAG: Bro-N domain-containing protein [Chthoniobacterales bacterium]|nr:Bro-N domain-containing protein [Chthoniobacterales bacterium]
MIEFFREEEGYTLRAANIDGQDWFVAKDVCDILEIGQAARAVQNLEEDEVSITHIIDSLGRSQNTTVINESGLYALIFRSRKPKAKEFRKWVTAEVLPAIRRTGNYRLMQGESAPPMPVAHPAVQFIEVIDALRMRGASTEKTLYSVGNLFQSALAGAYQSNRQVLPMVLPPPPDPALLPLPRPRRGENTVTVDAILSAMGDQAWQTGALQKKMAETQGVSQAAFYRAWNILRGQDRVTKDAQGLWVVVKGGAQ